MIERARQRGRIKHGGERQRVTLDENAVASGAEGEDLEAISAALDRLEARDPRKAEIVMLRFFAGLSVREAAEAMGKQEGTVRGLQFRAIAALRRQLGLGASPRTPAAPERSKR